MSGRRDASAASDTVERVVALGASNLTRGFQTLVASARSAWGPNVEIVAALGHGRSYGSPSRLAIRVLPSILDCGLWPHLESRPRVRARGLVTDVGNDILYGFSVEQILGWVGEAIHRLQHLTDDVVLTDLPLASIRRLSRTKFLLFRSLLVPSCRLSFDQVLEAAERVNLGLAELADARGIRFFRLDPEWYGFDPIHIRPSLWRPAWQEILGSPPATEDHGASRAEALRLYFMRPERQWLAGSEQRSPQRGRRLASGGRLWLY